ncbi:hypothetical protein TcWFU_007738 [Taenia crassiceps]|uniref:Uncharacterized protein n=1 Tax=Taenia crassiceps TaxID=6207 RepID=A0ABR4PYV6_9CEST
MCKCSEIMRHSKCIAANWSCLIEEASLTSEVRSECKKRGGWCPGERGGELHAAASKVLNATTTRLQPDTDLKFDNVDVLIQQIADFSTKIAKLEDVHSSLKGDTEEPAEHTSPEKLLSKVNKHRCKAKQIHLVRSIQFEEILRIFNGMQRVRNTAHVVHQALVDFNSDRYVLASEGLKLMTNALDNFELITGGGSTDYEGKGSEST